MQTPRKIKFINIDPTKVGKAGQPYISTSAMDARYADPPATAMAPGGPSPTAEATDKNISFIKEYFFTGKDAEKIIKYIISDEHEKDVVKFVTQHFGKQSFPTNKIKTVDTSVDEVIETDSHLVTYNPQSKYVFMYRKDKPLITEASLITEAEPGDELKKKTSDPDYIPSMDDLEKAETLDTPPEEAPVEDKPTEPVSSAKTDTTADKTPEAEKTEPTTEAPKPAEPTKVSVVLKKGDSVYFITKNKEKIRGKIEELVTTPSDSWYNFVSDDGVVDVWTKANTFNQISSAIVKPITSQK